MQTSTVWCPSPRHGHVPAFAGYALNITKSDMMATPIFSRSMLTSPVHLLYAQLPLSSNTTVCLAARRQRLRNWCNTEFHCLQRLLASEYQCVGIDPTIASSTVDGNI